MEGIETCDDVQRAVDAKPPDRKTRQLIIKKSIDLGCFDKIPDDWEMELDNGR